MGIDYTTRHCHYSHTGNKHNLKFRRKEIKKTSSSYIQGFQRRRTCIIEWQLLLNQELVMQ